MVVRHKWTEVETARLCDYVATDLYTFEEIAWLMERSRDSVTSQWRRIVKAMGWQAA